MSKLWKKAWKEFQHMISELDERDNSITIFQSIRGWYQKNQKLLSPRLIEEYGIEELINIEPKDYPLEQSESTPQDLRRFLRLELEPSSEESIIMFLRDELWEVVVLAVDVECQRCGKLQMYALFDPEAKKVVFECTQCGFVQATSGSPDESVRGLKLAQNDDLRKAGLV